MGRFEAIPDNLSPEEILAQAKAAAKDAADMLTLREPKSRVCINQKPKTRVRDENTIAI